MAKYAQIDETGLCFAVSELAGLVARQGMIAVSDNVDPLRKRYIAGEWVSPPAPPPTAQPISHLEFVDLLQAVGGITDEKLVAAKGDQRLGAFWVKFEIAKFFQRDNAATIAGLDALVAAGYLSASKKQTVMAKWPTS